MGKVSGRWSSRRLRSGYKITHTVLILLIKATCIHMYLQCSLSLSPSPSPYITQREGILEGRCPARAISGQCEDRWFLLKTFCPYLHFLNVPYFFSVIRKHVKKMLLHQRLARRGIPGHGGHGAEQRSRAPVPRGLLYSGL